MISTYAAPLLVLPRPVKRAFVLLIDALLCLVTVWLALCLRLEEWVTFGVTHWLVVLVSVVLALPLFVVNGLYRAIFRYSGWAAMLAVAKAVLIYTVLFAGILFVAQLPGVPRTLGLLQPILLLLAVGASRMAARYLFSGTYANLIRRSTLPKVLVYGAGSAGRQLAAAMANSMEMRAVGFLEDDRYLHGSVLNGLPIYPATDMAHWVQKLDVSHVLLAIPSASRQRRNEILEMARLANVSVRTLPGVDDLINGHVQVSDLRELDIEDLLGRDPVPPDVALLDRNVRGKVVLVTGAGGSIGSELCRQLIRSGPAKLLLVEASEFALYSIYHELEQLLAEQDHSHLELVPLLASVRDEPRLSEIMATWHPHYADAKIMPTDVGNTSCVVGIVAMESA